MKHTFPDSWKAESRWYKLKLSRNFFSCRWQRSNRGSRLRRRYNCQSGGWMDRRALPKPQKWILNRYSIICSYLSFLFSPPYSLLGSCGGMRLSPSVRGVHAECAVYGQCIKRNWYIHSQVWTSVNSTVQNLRVFMAQIQILDPPVARQQF